MPQTQSEAPDQHLERARDRVGGSKTAWCADYWRGECPVRGWWWRRSQKSNKPSKLPERYENGEKTGGFAHVLANESPKTPFFAQKYLTRYTHETFFKEYMNFETHYLSHCRVIPLQSFRSHIRPQPHGLGLTLSLTALGPISPISLKYQMLKKSLSEIKALLYLFLYQSIFVNLQ